MFALVETMIMPIDIQNFLASDAVKKIEEKLEKPCMAVVPSNFYDCRDYLLLRL